jgi:hypothetical protein
MTAGLGPVYTKGKRRYFHAVWPHLHKSAVFVTENDQAVMILKSNLGSQEYYPQPLFFFFPILRSYPLLV